MAFAKEQVEEIKKQLILEVEKLPNANKEQIKTYIEGLNEEQLEEFLKKNKIQISEKGIAQEPEEIGSQTKCIFCSIIKNEIPSYRIAENKKAVAVLEINPLSKGHVIIIPNDHTTIEKIPKSSLSLSQKIAKKIKKKLKPQDIKIETSSFQDHPMINVIPIYKDTPLKKTKVSEEELKKLQNKLETKKRSARTTKANEKPSSKLNLPEISFRIP